MASRLSRCSRAPRRGRILPSSRVLAVWIVLSAALGFGLSQAHLRFQINDLIHETARLQFRWLELDSKTRRLGGEVEQLRGGDRMIQHSLEDLGMVASSFDEIETIRIDPDLRERYAEAVVARAEARARETFAAGGGDAWPEALISRLGIAGRAVAADPKGANERD